MLRIGLLVTAAFMTSILPRAAEAGCNPVRADVVSLGEKPARAYATRSLEKGIEEEKQTIASTGRQIGRVEKKELTCKPFPNLIGANEWRCTGEARVCTKS
jgi:hypothetical protein